MKKKRKLLRALLFGLFFLVTACAIYIGIVLTYPEKTDTWVVAPDATTLPAIPDETFTSLSTLPQAFGALPVIADTDANFRGTLHCVPCEDGHAWLVTLDYGSAVLSAVKPLSAAPLILHDELSLKLREDLVCLGLSAILAGKDDALCLYFSDADTAYSLYAPHADESDFLALSQRLIFK